MRSTKRRQAPVEIEPEIVAVARVGRAPHDAAVDDADLVGARARRAESPVARRRRRRSNRRPRGGPRLRSRRRRRTSCSGAARQAARRRGAAAALDEEESGERDRRRSGGGALRARPRQRRSSPARRRIPGAAARRRGSRGWSSRRRRRSLSSARTSRRRASSRSAPKRDHLGEQRVVVGRRPSRRLDAAVDAHALARQGTTRRCVRSRAGSRPQDPRRRAAPRSRGRGSATSDCANGSGRPCATWNCSRTRSMPVTHSVTGCSTWMRVFISRK